MNKAERRMTYILLVVIGMFIGVALCCATVLIMEQAYAEDGPVYNCWIMCQPGSEVMIREKPAKKSAAVGAAGCGEKMVTDWVEKDGWLHLIDVNNETGEGWVYEGYVVFTEPKRIDAEMVIRGGGRVACRKWIGGKRTKWAAAGSRVTVYLMADEWAVTNKGYIQREYLEDI